MKPSIYTFYKALLLFVVCATHTLAQTTRIATTFSELQAAMLASITGDRILLPEGEIILTKTIVVKNGVKIIGTGAANTSVLKLSTGGHIEFRSNSELWNCTITRELPVAGMNGEPQMTASILQGSSNVRIENCVFLKNRTALYVNPGLTNIQINRNKFEDNRIGILITGTSTTPITNLQITGNDFINNRTFGIRIYKGSYFSIDATLTDNNFTGNLLSGINQDNDHASTSIKLRRNWFGKADPKFFPSTLDDNNLFTVQDHTSNHIDDPAISYQIDIAANMPYDISGAHQSKLTKLPPNVPSILYATQARPSTFNQFVPITITGKSDPYTTIQDAINSATNNDIINVPDGVYYEDIDVNKPVTIKGASHNTILKGLFSGKENTVLLGESATIENLTVTRDFGSTTYEWLSSSKFQGISITGNNATINNVKIADNRNGIYINNKQGYTVTNSLITYNRTGLQLVGDVSNGVITNNFIENNLTHGLMVNFDLHSMNASNLKVKQNYFSSNWYTALYFNGSNNGVFTGSDFTCNNYNTTAVAVNTLSITEPPYNQQLPPQLGGSNIVTASAILQGNKITNLQHAPWLNPITDYDASTAGFQLPTSFNVTPANGTKSASNNDFRILANALGCAVDGNTITLNGTFDFSETNALAEWAKGSDGASSITANDPVNIDNYAVYINRPLQNIKLTASSLGAAKIQGPGDIASSNLESFLSLNGTTNHGWKISNLEISGFDSSIGYRNNSATANNSEIFNNKITIPADLTNDTNQNIGILLTHGTQQKIYDNKIFFEGNGISDPGNNAKSNSIGIQNHTTGQHHYDGLEIRNNQFTVIGQPHATSPSNIIGIWDNAHGTASQITITENKFINEDLANTADKNMQLAIRVTSRSSSGKDVKLSYNHIEGFRSAIEWIGDDYATKHPMINFEAGSHPVEVTNNYIDKVMFGVVPRKDASSTNTGAPAIINDNRITNIVAGGKAISYNSGGLLNATCNWFGFAPDQIASIEGVLDGDNSNRTFTPYLYSGDNSASIGFTPTGECAAPIQRLAPQAYFAHIQDAIDDVNTTNGHTIQVAPFTYTLSSTINVNKSITLQGPTTGTKPTLKGTNDNGVANSRIYVSQPNVTIANLQIESTNASGASNNIWSAIRTAPNGDATNLTISNNTIINQYNSQSPNWYTSGIEVGSAQPSNKSNTVNIDKNTIEGFGRSVRLNAVNGTVTDNTIKGVHALSVAAYAVGGDFKIEDNNEFFGSVNLIGGSSATGSLVVQNNSFDVDPTIPVFYHLQVRENSSNSPTLISGNTFNNHEHFGVFVGRSNNVTIDNNTFIPEGSQFTNIAWNSKTESSGNLAPTKSVGFTVTKNTFNGTGGTGISFTNHNGATNIVPLENVTIGTQGNENIFASSLDHYIVLGNESGSANDLPLWQSQAFAGSAATIAYPFNVNFFTPYNKFGNVALAQTATLVEIEDIENKFIDKDDDLPSVGQIYVKAPVQNTNSGNFYLTIQPAIDEATSGDEIVVQPLTFDLITTIQITKSITLKGDDQYGEGIRPILKGTGNGSDKARIMVKTPATGSDVTINNFEIHVTQTGDDMVGLKSNNTAGHSQITIKNNLIKALSTEAYPVWASFGIDLGTNTAGKNSNVDIQDNVIVNPDGNGHFGRAIKVYSASGLIKNNTSTGSYAFNGIQFAPDADLVVEKNKFFGSVSMITGAGDGSKQLRFNNNEFKPIHEKEHRHSYYGLQIRDNDKPVSITNNQFNDYEFHSIFLGMTSNVNVINNMFTPKTGATNYTHIAWNTKSETSGSEESVIRKVPYENIAINGNTFNASGPGTAISFADHIAKSTIIPLKNITIGTPESPNIFNDGFTHYVYLDAQTGKAKTNETTGIWVSDAFGSAQDSDMLPFNQHVYVGNNKFGSSSATLASTLDKNATADLRALFHDFRDVNTLGHVFTRAAVLTDASDVTKSLHPTIQEAVNNAVDTDKIIAQAWEYVEDVQVNKSVSITGNANGTKPEISKAGGAARFLVSVPNVTIDNFNIKVSAQGSDMHGIKTTANGTFNGLAILNNTITNTNTDRIWGSFGMELGSATPSVANTVTITNNSVENFGRSARLNFVNGSFTQNTLEGTHALSTGVFAFGNDFLIQENNFYGSVNMIGSTGATGTLTVQQNTFDATPATVAPFYLLQIRESGTNATVNIANNQFKNHEQYGVFIGRSNNVTLDNNTFTPTGNAFTNIAWNSKTESSSTLAPTKSVGFTVTKNTFNGTGGTGISFTNHNGATNIVPLENVTIGTQGNENIFASSLDHYIVLGNESGSANDLPLWQSQAFAGASATNAYPFNVDFYAYHNKFGSNASPLALTLSYTDIQAIEAKVTDQDDIADVGQVYFRSPVRNERLEKEYPTITKALQEVSDGDKLMLDEWIYKESITITTPNLTIERKASANAANTILTPLVACTGSSTVNGVTIESSNVTLNGFTIRQFRDGVIARSNDITLEGMNIVENCFAALNVTGHSHNLVINNSKLNQNRYGVLIGPTISANNMNVTNSEIKENGRIGLLVEMGLNSGSTFNDVTITKTDFSSNIEKGIYIEKANNLKLQQITVNDCGTLEEEYIVNQGIDINLKYGNYSNIEILNSSIQRSGQLLITTPGQPVDAPSAISIKARNDGGYASNPATLTNVTIKNNIINGKYNGLRIGEYGVATNTSPTNVTISENNFAGIYLGKVLVNTTTSVVNANCNWWGVSNLASVTAMTKGDVYINTFLGNGTNMATDSGFTPDANCNAGRADYSLNMIFDKTVYSQAAPNGIMILRLSNITNLPQTGHVRIIINKVTPSFNLTLPTGEQGNAFVYFGDTYNLDNNYSEISIQEFSTQYLITISAARLIPINSTINLGFKIESLSTNATSTLNAQIANSDDDNPINNQLGLSIFSN